MQMQMLEVLWLQMLEVLHLQEQQWQSGLHESQHSLEEYL